MVRSVENPVRVRSGLKQVVVFALAVAIAVLRFLPGRVEIEFFVRFHAAHEQERAFLFPLLQHGHAFFLKDGIQGSFRILFDDQGKFASIERL